MNFFFYRDFFFAIFLYFFHRKSNFSSVFIFDLNRKSLFPSDSIVSLEYFHFFHYNFNWKIIFLSIFQVNNFKNYIFPSNLLLFHLISSRKFSQKFLLPPGKSSIGNGGVGLPRKWFIVTEISWIRCISLWMIPILLEGTVLRSSQPRSSANFHRILTSLGILDS